MVKNFKKGLLGKCDQILMRKLLFKKNTNILIDLLSITNILFVLRCSYLFLFELNFQVLLCK